MRQEWSPRTLTTTVRYAGTSGDLNPLHYDPAAAARAGFDRVIVHGAYLAAFLERAACRELGSSPTEYRVRFVKPLKIGEDFATICSRDGVSVEASIQGTDGASDIRVSGAVRAGGYSSPVERGTDFERLGDPYPWQVELGALRTYVQATGDDEPAPDPTSTIPLCFLSNAGRWTPAKESIVRRLRFAYDRMLHGETIIQVFGDPLHIGDRLLVQEAHGNRSERPHKSGGTMRVGDAIHELSDLEGKLRARVINRMIERPARRAQ